MSDSTIRRRTPQLPCAGWDASAMARAPAGAVVAAAARGQDQLSAVVDDIRRAADLRNTSPTCTRRVRAWATSP